MAAVASVKLEVNASQALQQLKAVDQASSGLNAGFKAAGVGAKGLGAAIGSALAPILAVSTAVKVLTDSFGLLANKEADVSNLQRGLKGLVADTGAASQALLGIADQLGKQTLFNEEDFTQGFKLLTSFRSIATDSYERVATAAADVATVTNQDVNSSLMQLAKALQDPEKGLTALARSGTQFTEQQKQQINAMVASGDVLGAQNLILKEIEAQYGGAAKAAGSAGFAGVMDTLGEVTRDAQRALAAILASPLQSFFSALGIVVAKVAEYWEWLGSTLSTKILPIIQPLIDKFQELIGGLDISSVMDIWQGGMVVAVNLLAKGLELVVPAAMKVIDILAAIGRNPVFQALIAPLKALVKGLIGASGEISDFKKKSEGSKDALTGINTEAQKLPAQIQAAREAQEQKTAAVQAELTALKAASQEISNQIGILDSTKTLQSKRFEVEKALNSLEQQKLERQYKQQQTAEGRLRVLIKIYKTQLEAARIEFDQAIESIKIEYQKIELQLQQAVIKKDEIRLEASLQRLKAQSIEDEAKRAQKINEINGETDNALGLQDKVISGLAKEQTIQKAILAEEAKLAEIKYEAAKLQAQEAFEQRAVTEEIGLSEKAAYELSERLKEGTEITRDFAVEFAEVTRQAQFAASAIRQATGAATYFTSSSVAGNIGSYTPAAEGAYWPGGFKAFANGGMVSQPTLGLVGEGGEPEYIIPASKMDEAMARYASGQRGSNVIPNAATSEAGSYSAGTSSINPVVNVTTGPVMNMNNRNYVSQADFLAGLQVATRQGAQMALATLQGNNSMRRSVGIR